MKPKVRVKVGDSGLFKKAADGLHYADEAVAADKRAVKKATPRVRTPVTAPTRGKGWSKGVKCAIPASPRHAAAVRKQIAFLKANQSEYQAMKTTYAAAVIKYPNGRIELVVAGAGRSGRIDTDLRNGFRRVVSPILGEDLEPHINDAERHIKRYADDIGAEVKAIGATNWVCHSCQDALDGIPIVTPLKPR